jgi:Fe-S cluster biogenesis protein NfuA/nitrite reductase/ring-hydroxylating ferredoxin subunit
MEGAELVGRVEGLLAEAEQRGDAGAIGLAQALLELYGEGLERVVDAVAAHDDGRMAAALASDELVAHLLLLHGLHPQPLEERVREALAEVRPYLESHGGDVELLGIEAGVVRLRMEGSCSGCPSSRVTLKLAIEEAILKSAPDVEAIEADGAAEPAPAPLLQIETVRREPAEGAWTSVGNLPDVAEGTATVRFVEGEELLFVRLGRSGVYAYRSACPRCGGSLDGAGVEGAALACRACGGRFDVRHAGRGLDDADERLEPIPLLVDDDGSVRVALGAPA